MGFSLQLAAGIAAALIVSACILFLDLARQPALLTVAVLLGCCAAPIVGVIAARLSAGDADSSHPPSQAQRDDGAREEGEIKWFNVSKGFGFIRRDTGEEIFVHFRSIRGPNRDRRQLRDGQRVSYVVVDSDKGPQAEEVETVGEESASG